MLETGNNHHFTTFSFSGDEEIGNVNKWRLIKNDGEVIIVSKYVAANNDNEDNVNDDDDNDDKDKYDDKNKDKHKDKDDDSNWNRNQA